MASGWIQTRERRTTAGKTYKTYAVRWRADGTVKTKTFLRSADARDYLNSLKGKISDGTYRDPELGKILMRDFFDYFMKNSPKPLRPNTRRLYEMHGRLYVVPRLGTMPLNSIRRPDVSRFLTDLRADGVGASTIQHVHRLLRRVLSFAVFEERIQTNPAAGYTVDGGEKREARFLSADEVERLANAHPARYRALVRLACWRGPRIGELAFLRVRHLNFLERKVTIEGTASTVNGKLVEGPTKTGKVRSFVVPQEVWRELVDHLQKHSNPADPDAFVFPSDEGHQLRPDNYRKRVFNPSAQRVGIAPRPTVHDMRHTAASLMAQQGYSLMQAAQVLGHSTQFMTSTYTGLFPEDFEHLATREDEAIRVARAKVADGQAVVSLRSRR